MLVLRGGLQRGALVAAWGSVETHFAAVESVRGLGENDGNTNITDLQTPMVHKWLFIFFIIMSQKICSYWKLPFFKEVPNFVMFHGKHFEFFACIYLHVYLYVYTYIYIFI